MFDIVTNEALGVAITLPRIAAAFLMLPLLTAENMPAMVRNSFFVSLSITAVPIASSSAQLDLIPTAMWAPIVLKEIFVGVVIGFSFGIVFWALGAAGEIIDAKVGTNIAQIADPIQGHQTSMTGSFLSQLAAWLFMASGAFLIFLDILLSSYKVWPILVYVPELTGLGLSWFINQFSFLMTLALVFAAPAIVIMMLLDFSLGLMNRFAQQLNVFALSMPIKAWIATWVMILMLGAIVEQILNFLFRNRQLLEHLRSIVPMA